jgi:hypothetical protein
MLLIRVPSIDTDDPAISNRKARAGPAGPAGPSPVAACPGIRWGAVLSVCAACRDLILPVVELRE